MGLMYDFWKDFASRPIPDRLGKTLEEVFHGTPILPSQELTQERVRGVCVTCTTIDDYVQFVSCTFGTCTPRDNTEANCR